MDDATADFYVPNSLDIDLARPDQLQAWAAILVLGWEFKKIEFVAVDHGVELQGTPVVYCWAVPGETGIRYDLPNFTLSMDAAAILIDNLAKRWVAEYEPDGCLYRWSLAPEQNEIWEARIMRGQLNVAAGRSSWLELAITQAATRYCLEHSQRTPEQLQSLITFHHYHHSTRPG